MYVEGMHQHSFCRKQVSLRRQRATEREVQGSHASHKSHRRRMSFSRTMNPYKHISVFLQSQAAFCYEMLSLLKIYKNVRQIVSLLQ